jgi:DNA primase
MPLNWSQVTAQLRLERFNIRNASRVLAKNGDPVLPVLSGSIDMLDALDRLQRQFARSR